MVLYRVWSQMKRPETAPQELFTKIRKAATSSVLCNSQQDSSSKPEHCRTKVGVVREVGNWIWLGAAKKKKKKSRGKKLWYFILVKESIENPLSYLLTFLYEVPPLLITWSKMYSIQPILIFSRESLQSWFDNQKKKRNCGFNNICDIELKHRLQPIDPEQFSHWALLGVEFLRTFLHSHHCFGYLALCWQCIWNLFEEVQLERTDSSKMEERNCSWFESLSFNHT